MGGIMGEFGEIAGLYGKSSCQVLLIEVGWNWLDFVTYDANSKLH